MKNLNEIQMESLNGGASCAVAAAVAAGTFALGTASIILSGGTTASLAIFLGGRVLSAINLGNACGRKR